MQDSRGFVSPRELFGSGLEDDLNKKKKKKMRMKKKTDYNGSWVLLYNAHYGEPFCTFWFEGEINLIAHPPQTLCACVLPRRTKTNYLDKCYRNDGPSTLSSHMLMLDAAFQSRYYVLALQPTPSITFCEIACVRFGMAVIILPLDWKPPSCVYLLIIPPKNHLSNISYSKGNFPI